MCCLAKGSLKGRWWRKYSFGKHRAEQVFNSPALVQARQLMARGEPVKACRLCYRSEKDKKTSYRLHQNQKWQAELGVMEDEIIREAKRRHFHLPYKPVSLHLNLSNLCNLKCRMCWSGNSSEIEADPVHSRWAPSPKRIPKGKERIRQKREFFQDNFDAIRDIVGDMTDLREIYFTGGEPTIMPSVRDMLEYLLKEGRSDIAIRMNTNATSLNRSFMELLRQFRALTINFSLDGTGESYEYIRFPARWENVKINIDRFRQAFPDATFHAMPTIQIYNVFNLMELKHFCDQAGIEMSVTPLYGPLHLAVTILPQPARDKAADMVADILPNFARYLRVAPSTQTPRRVRKFMLFTNDLDKSRGQDFCKTYPNIVEYFDRAGFPWIDKTRYA